MYLGGTSFDRDSTFVPRKITDKQVNGDFGRSQKIPKTDENGLGKSRKITETALQAPVTTEPPSRYGAKMHTKNRMESKTNEAIPLWPSPGEGLKTKYGLNRDFGASKIARKFADKVFSF